jgi:hypothetical protein
LTRGAGTLSLDHLLAARGHTSGHG